LLEYAWPSHTQNLLIDEILFIFGIRILPFARGREQMVKYIK